MKKILIVDDDPVQQQHLCGVLKPLNAQLSVANNGQEALIAAERDMPDLILMDIIMPGVDGYAACRGITSGEKTKQIPVIIVSSKNQEADRVWAQLQGAKALIGKPYSDEEMLAQVNAFL